MTTTPTTTTDAFLQDLADELEISPARYEAAERSYHSVGDWLHREGSSLRAADPQVYIQGSFRLGTAIRPASDDEDYDVDLVCELSFGKSQLTQSELKEKLGAELHAYAKKHNMEEPEPGRRCWTLNYADGAQFHLDALPAVPDGEGRRLILASKGMVGQWTASAIAITDEEHENYERRLSDWPHSNPKGYAEWFKTRMAVVFERRRRALASKVQASVETIPEHRVKTPLQQAIMILKRHRDVTFDGDPDDKPISIIITTLAALAYNQEDMVSTSLYSILGGMDRHIEERNGVAWIPNPTDPLENFADKWQTHPRREKAFRLWLAAARADFAAAARAYDRRQILEVLEPRLGGSLVEAALNRRIPAGQGRISRIGTGLKAAAGAAARIVLGPPHRQLPPWDLSQGGSVLIRSATMIRNGFLPKRLESDGEAVPKGVGLTFQATTNVPRPYKVYWQVVNTGDEARIAGGLRGGFEEGVVSRGRLIRHEGSSYRGKHPIECFIVKGHRCVARSGQFIVNIQ